jgi:hypothetical protein
MGGYRGAIGGLYNRITSVIRPYKELLQIPKEENMILLSAVRSAKGGI